MILSVAVLALTLAQPDGGPPADTPIAYPDCPEAGDELAIPLEDGGYWLVPAQRLARTECRLATAEAAIRGDPRVTVERMGVPPAAAVGIGAAASIVSILATILLAWRPWERRCPGP